jgi:hypothetical protein
MARPLTFSNPNSSIAVGRRATAAGVSGIDRCGMKTGMDARAITVG